MSVVGRNVWMFRETRSGSTGFTQSLADALDRKFHWITRFSESDNDPTKLFNTHEFQLINDVVENYDPILIRCSRRNKTEQFLSLQTYHLTRIMLNITPNTNAVQFEKFNQFMQSRVEINESSVIRYAQELLEIDEYWRSASSKQPSQIVYYEDMSDPIDLSVVGLYNITLDRDKYTIRFPDYKKSVYNYYQVENWINNHYHEHCT